MVFCASLVPCASETIEAEPIWPTRKPRVRVPSGIAAGDPVDEQRADGGDSARRSAGRAPRAGRPWTPGRATARRGRRPRRAPRRSRRRPARATSSRGCPGYQVARFHRIPPASPANTTAGVTRCVCTKPLAMVAATLKERKAPARFRTPDRATATRGGNASVAMDVAIALPVSWKPLVKSNPRAVTTTSTRRTLFSVTGARYPVRDGGSGPGAKIRINNVTRPRDEAVAVSEGRPRRVGRGGASAAARRRRGPAQGRPEGVAARPGKNPGRAARLISQISWVPGQQPDLSWSAPPCRR